MKKLIITMIAAAVFSTTAHAGRDDYVLDKEMWGKKQWNQQAQQPVFSVPFWQTPRLQIQEPVPQEQPGPVVITPQVLEPKPTVRKSKLDPKFERQEVPYFGNEKPGTIIVNTKERMLYLVVEGGRAIRYGVGVGRRGFGWSGIAKINRKAEWPAWHPPEEMRKREAKKGRHLPTRMEGGINNPLGARALYLFQGERDTLYRIHGTNNPSSIGMAASSGCIRLTNENIEDLYNRVKIKAKVIVI